MAPSHSFTAFVGLGSNLGDRLSNLNQALKQIRQFPKTQALKVSRWHETDPVGGPPQGKFLNGVVQLETALSPKELLQHLQGIERHLGRPAERIRWGPRVIDLDLLAYGDLRLEEPDLQIPHPLLHERTFVLTPLAEIAPDWRHPRLGKTALELLKSHENHQRSS